MSVANCILRKVIVFQLVIKKRQFIKILSYQLVRSVLSETSTEPRSLLRFRLRGMDHARSD